LEYGTGGPDAMAKQGWGVPQPTLRTMRALSPSKQTAYKY